MQKFAISDVFCPKLFTSLKHYDKKTLTQDIVAGIIVAWWLFRWPSHLVFHRA